MTLHMKTYILAAIAALVLIAPRTAVAGSLQIQGLDIDATTAGALSAGADRDKLNAAITNETDSRAMKLYHYGDPDIEITPESDFTFNAGTITGYIGSNPDIVLPYEINGVPVVAIGPSAFKLNYVVKTLIAPKTLTSIGANAFNGSTLTSLVAPSLTTLGDYAFTYSSLTSLVAPSLTTIGKQAFDSSSLKSLVAPSLTSIGDFAFAYSSLTNLVAPSLTTLGNYAFAYSSLTAIYYGGNQPTADEGIYEGTHTNNLVNYVTSATATGWGDNFGGKTVVRLPLYADEVHIGGELAATQPYVDNAIANIPPVVIPDETDPRAMKLYHYGDPDIQITPTSDFGFNAASGTITGYVGHDEDVIVPYEINGVPVVAIGSSAFQYDDVVKTIKVSKTLTSIGNYAFYNSSLTAIYYGGNQPTAGVGIYYNTPTNLVNYVTNPTATGWGDRFGDRSVVRMPLYADEVHIKGSLAATQPFVTNAIANIPPVVIPDETDPIAMAALATHTNSTANPHVTTLAGAAAAGGFAGTETITPLNIVMGGYWQALIGDGVSAIDSTASGASQSGENYGDQSIGNYASGASQSGHNTGTQTIGSSAYGASQSGFNYGASQSIGSAAYGASQRGFNYGDQSIGNYASGAIQAGSVANGATAENNAVGAMQLFDLTEGQHALTTPGGKASIGLGAVTVSNKNSIVVGDGNVSHGDGSMTANSFWQNNIRMATIDDIPKVPAVTAQYSAWTTNVIAASGTNIITSAWGNQPRLELNGSAAIDFDFAEATAGIHRLTLSLWSGTNSVAWLTNNVDFAEAPELSTNAYNTILIRKIGAAKAQGRQL